MKRKFVSIVLAALMVVGMIPFAAVPAFAESQEPESEYLSETIVFNNNGTAESKHFTLTANMFTGEGWFGGCDGFTLTITPKTNGNLLIRNIEAVVSNFGDYYSGVGISSGTNREAGDVDDGTTVHIDGVDEYSFSFVGGSDFSQFKDITVFYEFHEHTPTLFSVKEATETEHGISTSYYYCDGCGKYFSDVECTNRISKETADSYIIHNWSEEWSQGDAKGHVHPCICTGCSATIGTAAHTGYIDDGVCDVCGYSGIFAETIIFNNNDTAESEHFTLTAGSCDGDGWYGGDNSDVITITPKNNKKLLIKNIEAVIGFSGAFYDGVGISSGTKRELNFVSDGTTVHIDGVNDYSFSFAGGSDFSQFKDITVFYEFHEHTPTLFSAKEATETEHGISTAYYYCESCGKYFSDAQCENEITKATVDGYIIHNWSEEWSQGDAKGHVHHCICTGCSATTGTVAHTGYSEDGVCDVCGYSGIFAETIIFNNNDTAESEHFALTAGSCDGDGWLGGDDFESITVTPKDNEKFFIRNIEAVIGCFGLYYNDVGISSGTKRETEDVNDGSVVHIDGVDAYSFSFAGGRYYSQFKDITVFYEFHEHTPTLFSAKEATETEHGISTAYYYCESCGKYFSDAQCENEITKATVDGYIIHNWSEEWSQGDAKGHVHPCICTGCSATTGTVAHTGYSEDGVCDVCGYSGIFAETIIFNNSKTAESEHFALTAGSCDENGWFGGGYREFVTVTPKKNKRFFIKNIEAVIGYAGAHYNGVGISSGTKRELNFVSDGTTVHIDGVDAYSFSFAEGNNFLQFKDITVFYEFHEHTPTLFSVKEATETEHGISTSYYYCDGCGGYFSDSECTNEITKATVDSYTVHNWFIRSADAKGHNCTCTCTGCNAQSVAHTGYIDDGVCDVCGYSYSGIFAETIVFNNNDTAESEYFTLYATRVDENGWYCGGDRESITVTPKNNEKLLIKNIEAVVGAYGAYSEVGVSGGTKRETEDVSDGTTVHIDGVNATSFSFTTGGENYSQFKDITVYFYDSHTYEIILGAKAAIDAAAGVNPSKSVKRIADGAKADIDSAMTAEEIMAIRDECIADIEKLTGTVHEHTFSTEWSYNETVHWHEAICEHTGIVSEFGDHTFGTDGKCTVCGYEKTAGEKKYTVILTGISNPEKHYSGATDDSGICNIENIENGTYLMAISCEGAVTRTYTTEITDSTIRQDIELYDNGDVNGDGEITVEDYSAAVNAALACVNEVPEDLSLDADYIKAVADIDCDGVVDVLDVALLERKINA